LKGYYVGIAGDLGKREMWTTLSREEKFLATCAVYKKGLSADY